MANKHIMVPALDGSQLKATPLKFALKLQSSQIYIIYKLDHLNKKFAHDILVSFPEGKKSNLQSVVDGLLRAHTMYLDRIPSQQIMGLVKKLFDHQFGKKSPQKDDDWDKDFENSDQK